MPQKYFTIPGIHHMILRMHKHVLLIIFLFSSGLSSKAQDIVLSGDAEISVVVADPGTVELFEVFGHP
ncbi:MAG: hypothetical protein KAQ79_02475, partial [Cyclobacteriaceae bacterium]|nr:hypothetical protein [Cyclobacteriaceae bacterium]